MMKRPEASEGTFHVTLTLYSALCCSVTSTFSKATYIYSTPLRFA